MTWIWFPGPSMAHFSLDLGGPGLSGTLQLIHYPEICIDDYFLGARPKTFSGDSGILPSSLPTADRARPWGQPLHSTGNQLVLFLPTEWGPAVQMLAAVAEAQLARVSDSPSVRALYNLGLLSGKGTFTFIPTLAPKCSKNPVPNAWYSCWGTLYSVGRLEKQGAPRSSFKAYVTARRSSFSDRLNLEQLYKGTFTDSYTKCFLIARPLI